MAGFSCGCGICVYISLHAIGALALILCNPATMLMEMKWEGDERLRAGGSEESYRNLCMLSGCSVEESHMKSRAISHLPTLPNTLL